MAIFSEDMRETRADLLEPPQAGLYRQLACGDVCAQSQPNAASYPKQIGVWLIGWERWWIGAHEQMNGFGMRKSAGQAQELARKPR